MSHFITLVFTKENGRTVEELLAPYDENIVYAPYVLYTREQAIAKIRKEIEDYNMYQVQKSMRKVTPMQNILII